MKLFTLLYEAETLHRLPEKMGCCYLGMEGSTTVNGNSSSNSSCWLGQAQEDEGLELVVAVEVASLALTLGLARFIHRFANCIFSPIFSNFILSEHDICRNVETKHPVYAVLYQNSLLLATVQSACLALLLSAMLFEGLLLEPKASCSPLRMWAVFEPILAAVSAVLNSAHWLVVNALRQRNQKTKLPFWADLGTFPTTIPSNAGMLLYCMGQLMQNYGTGIILASKHQ